MSVPEQNADAARPSRSKSVGLQPANPHAVTTSTSETRPIVVHHLNNSRSQRILWLLEELGVPYEIKFYRRSDWRAPPELLDVNPLGKSPVISDGDLNLAESGAIVEYLIGKYGKASSLPPDAYAVDNLYFTHYAEGSLMPVIVQQLINSIVPSKVPFLIRPFAKVIFDQINKVLVTPELEMHVKFIETHLINTGGWFASGSVERITSADYMMLFSLESLVKLGHGRDQFVTYIERVHERDAFKRVSRS